MPVVVLNSPHVSDKRIGGSNPPFGTALDIVGIILWAIGWAIESTADVQKVSESEIDSCGTLMQPPSCSVPLEIIETSEGSTAHCELLFFVHSDLYTLLMFAKMGVWKWSRHPPYFGE